MTDEDLTSPEELWKVVAALHDDLLSAGSTVEARRLHAAMTVSAHPGEVWPETGKVLEDLLRDPPAGLDTGAAQRAARYLASWP